MYVSHAVELFDVASNYGTLYPGPGPIGPFVWSSTSYDIKSEEALSARNLNRKRKDWR